MGKPNVTDIQPGPSVQELLDRERVAVPALLRQTSTVDMGSADVPKDRYLSRAVHDLEVEKVWKRVWQMACREDDIPEVGDTLVYDVAHLSILVVRAAPDTIKAFPNSCLHRGNLLRTGDGNVRELRCSYHGFCWSLDGELKDLPCPWDFPHVTPEEFRLPEVRVGRWEGFIFINMDPGASPLEEYLGGLVDQVSTIGPLGNRFKAAHVAKIVKANWKIALEAFMESFHATSTHPQLALFSGDANTQYDVYPGQPHWDREIIPNAVPSPMLGSDVSEEDVASALEEIFIQGFGFQREIKVLDGGTAREAAAKTFRELLLEMMGLDTSALTDCQVIDTIGYSVFPNLQVYVPIVQSFTARFRPYGDDPGLCVMDVMLLYPLPPGAPQLPSAPVRWLGPDEPFAAAGELQLFGSILDQDIPNIEGVQRGLQASTKVGVTLGKYQESRIRHFHQVLGRYVQD
jgi:nitrite reductase/ring-hydroxylating ferredoxin subunit